MRNGLIDKRSQFIAGSRYIVGIFILSEDPWLSCENIGLEIRGNYRVDLQLKLHRGVHHEMGGKVGDVKMKSRKGGIEDGNRWKNRNGAVGHGYNTEI